MINTGCDVNLSLIISINAQSKPSSRKHCRNHLLQSTLPVPSHSLSPSSSVTPSPPSIIITQTAHVLTVRLHPWLRTIIHPPLPVTSTHSIVPRPPATLVPRPSYTIATHQSPATAWWRHTWWRHQARTQMSALSGSVAGPVSGFHASVTRFAAWGKLGPLRVWCVRSARLFVARLLWVSKQKEHYPKL